MPTVAIIGASADRSKFGNKAVRAYVRMGWTVYPIHPKEPQIEGIPAYKSVKDAPRPIQRVALYVPPEVGIKLLADIQTVGPEEMFVNPGAENDALLAKAEELGIPAVQACAIVDVGVSPADL